ncbi:MAG: hypothetical protein IPP19_04260 [Verrucomicrobia bacterium]|nr:hypothetical protein [Verrucomicrobiota bacterium]
MPDTRDEIRATLDDLRTVRWLVEHQVIVGAENARLDHEFANRLGALDRALRSGTKPDAAPVSAVETFKVEIHRARESARERLIGEIGKTDYQRLKEIASDRKVAEQSGHLAYVLGSTGEPGAWLASPLVAQLKKIRARSLADPASQALFDYGPLPAAASEAFGIQVLGAEVAGDIKVPDLLHNVSESEAFALIKEALAAHVGLDWSEAGPTAEATARWLAIGRLDASQEWSREFLDQLLNTWKAPSAPRAEAALALIGALEARAAKSRKPDEDEDFAAVYKPKRALCLIASGRGNEAAAAIGDAEFSSWEVFAALAPENSRAIAEFALKYLPQHPGSFLSFWETMQANAHRAQLDAEALNVLLQHREKIYGDAEALTLKARIDAGQFEEAAAALQEITKRPYTSDGYAPTQRRTEAILRLVELGEAHQRPEWRDQAMDRLQALIAYWTNEKAGCGDGGDPWARLPGLLVSKGRLSLALAAAKLNVRWRLQAADIGEVFLMPEAERQNYILKGPASAMAGLLQVLALQKKPQAIIDYLQTEKDWPARDLIGVVAYADPSFPAANRQTIGVTVANALEALDRKAEAQRIRNLATLGWDKALAAFLAGKADDVVSIQDRKALELLVGNEISGGETITLIQIAGAIERAQLVTETWRYPESVFPLKAATARIDGWMQNGPPVPLPPIKSLRTRIVGSMNALGGVRDALLLNVPDSY